MTTIQESKLNMYLAVRNFIIQNEEYTKDLPNFSVNHATLLNTISQIQAIGEVQKYDKKGLTIEKNKLKDSLKSIAADYSRKITAYAKFSNNDTLLSEARFSTSDLAHMTDVALKDYIEIICDIAEANLASLTEYGVTADTQKTLRDTIEAYNTSLSTPRTGIAEKSEATRKLAGIFATADNAILNMDYSVGVAKLTKPDFYNGYKSSRKRVSTSTGYLSLKALATDVTTGEPVKGVIFSFRINGNKSSAIGGNGEIVKKTADKGIFHIKNMPSGTYQVKISKPGYKDKEVTVSVADNERSDLEVSIEKA